MDTMRSGEQANGRRWIGGAIAPLVLAVAAGGVMPAQAAGEGQPAATDVARRPAPGRHQAHGLEDRVKILSKALDLDAGQQLDLKKILEGQREQVMKAWSDPSVAPAYRVLATQAIGDRTADQIRALLNDEQRKKYGAPRQAREAGGAGPGVEDWMKRG
jgi:Spy/CpxP family protein refolding chaperone